MCMSPACESVAHNWEGFVTHKGILPLFMYRERSPHVNYYGCKTCCPSIDSEHGNDNLQIQCYKL